MKVDDAESRARDRRRTDGFPAARLSEASRDRPRVVGKFLFAGEEKLFVKGLTYGPFRPNRTGEPFPEPSTATADFRRIAALGGNAIRTYDVPPPWLLEEAAAAGLRVMVGLPWEQHIAWLDEPGRPERVDRVVRSGVRRCAGHPAVLCYAIGNEIPAQVVRWSGRRRVEAFLRRLYDVAKEQDPDGLVTYVNYPSTEYLRLEFADVACFNVYLEAVERLVPYLRRLHHIAGERPLLMGEIGLDARTHGEGGQACGLDAQIGAAFESGCAGAFVFSWTDEWHAGGRPIEEWRFGITTPEREPKPAATAVRRAFRAAPFGAEREWPRISVVICAHDAAATLGDCLEGAISLRYPDYEVIVVDDGSTDATSEIASRFDVRLIRTRNGGLSKARNVGIHASTGEIVAFTDADARPDPDWLRYLALAFEDGRYGAVGGPNLAPRDEGRVADCVARAPGGPIHVLLSDEVAEHVPGCNMAFRREVLSEIGGFDPRFRVAGDDVDICWRVQARGHTIGFSPSALVWHHPRNSVRAYWRQQCGYGRAEALLEQKWPEKYNSVGHITWGGRVYGGARSLLLRGRSRVYHGVWGAAPFQMSEPPSPRILASLASSPEWYLLLAALAGLSLLGLAWPPLLLALPLLALSSGVVLVEVALAGARAPLPGVTDRDERWRRRALIALLHLIQPVARLWGRLRHGLTPWRLRTERRYVRPTAQTVFLWSEKWRRPAERLERLERYLLRRRAVVLRGSAFDRWDLLVKGGLSGRIRVRACTEEHGQGRQFVRLRASPSVSPAGVAIVATLGVLGIWAVADGALLVGLLLGAVTGMTAVRAALECGGAVAAVLEATRELELDEARASSEPDPAKGSARPPPAGGEEECGSAALRAGEEPIVAASGEDGTGRPRKTPCYTPEPRVTRPSAGPAGRRAVWGLEDGRPVPRGARSPGLREGRS